MLPAKLLRKFTAGAIAIAISGSVFLAPALAQTPTPSGTLRERIGERVQNRCERVTTRINERIEHYDTNKQRHIEHYEKITDKLTTLVSRLDAKGYDTSKLNEDLKTLDKMVREFAVLYSQFIDTLKGAKGFACGSSEGQFLQAIQEAQSFLRQSRQQAKEIRSFLQNTIKADLKELRAQKPEQN
ncbi:MAG TPA: hypothetical protein VJ065_00415 [Patescibacteria group bacterium]|nr:hypothetical protein [Patescibacteria group bacterium]